MIRTGMGESHLLDDEISRESAGAMLRRGREAAGLELAEIADVTKIPERHLQTMESGEFSALPARAYAVGFARSYARAVGLDEREIAQRVRQELDEASTENTGARPNTFEAGDPARVPSSQFAWLAAGLALIVVAAGFLFWRSFYSPAAELPPVAIEEPELPADVPALVTADAAVRQVVFTATAPDVWVRLYDTNGTRLLEKNLAEGESFEVPANVQAPLLWTARPEALAITVGGRAVPRLAETQQTMKDVPVDAATLLARPERTASQPVAPATAQTLARPAPAPRAPAPAPLPEPPAPEAEPAAQSGAADSAAADNP
jgi:cytoskeleton protein RodZ